MRSQGRRVPELPEIYKQRQIDAFGLYQANADAVHAAVATLPVIVRLGDGRKLEAVIRKVYQYAYRGTDGMAVLASYDATPHGLLLHVSVSYAAKDPTWSDLKLLRAAFFLDDVDVIQVLPRAGEFVNVHEHCFHLFEAPSEWQGGLLV